MRTVLLILFLFVYSLCVSAQNVGVYTDSHGESFDIHLICKKGKPQKISIECAYDNNRKGEIWIKIKDVEKFRLTLISVKELYQEWIKIAEDNDVKDVRKEMPIKFPRVEFVWGYATTFLGNAAFTANWVRKAPFSLVICTAFVEASNNQFVDECFNLSFYNPDDIQSLIDAISQENIDKAIKNANAAELFDTNSQKDLFDVNIHKKEKAKYTYSDDIYYQERIH